MTYTVYYKNINDLFWKKLKNVKGDGMIDETSGFMGSVPGSNLPTFMLRTHNSGRWFILSDESRIEIPSDSVIFKFSKERHYLIKEQMSKEAHQPIV